MDDFILENVAFEARFERGYLYWDNCGKIWLAISEKWPQLQYKEVTVDSAKFILAGSEIGLNFSQNNFVVAEGYQEKPDQFIKFAEDSLKIFTDLITIDNFSRIGLRYVYFVKLDVDTVTELLLEKELITFPKRIIALGKKLSARNVIFVIEKEDIKITVRTGFGRKKLDMAIPKPLIVDMSKFINEGFYIDLDFFSDKIVDIGTFIVKSFIEVHGRNAHKLIDTLLL